MNARETGSRATWCPCGLSGLQETSNENILRLTINPNQWNLYMVRIPWNTCIYEDLPHKETPSPPRKPRSVLHYYKNPKAPETNVRIIYPSSSTLKWWKFSNLTFGGSLADTIPVLSVGFFSFFVVQVLSRACEDSVAFWGFLASLVGAICGEESKPEAILPLPR